MDKPHDIPTSYQALDTSTSDEIYGLPSAANRSLSDLISPDDWRLYHLMRELTNDDRHSVLTFAEMLFSLREARRRAESIVDSR
jgi:hypothetical protein